jgi:RNA polymerase sigma-70 factor, ECF subfamily
LKAARPIEEERLRIEAAQKDPRLFAELYEDNFQCVYAYIARRVNNRAEAEDLTADVFHSALSNLAKFEWRGAPFSAWLYRIAANSLADRWEKAARERGNASPEVVSKKEMEEIERRAWLFRMVEELPAEQRRVVELRFGEGKSAAEIASELGKTAGAVRQIQFRALEKLRELASRKAEVRDA